MDKVADALVNRDDVAEHIAEAFRSAVMEVQGVRRRLRVRMGRRCEGWEG